MNDVTVSSSRYRITFTPDEGEEMILLDVGDVANEEPALEGGPQVATHALIDSAWAHHKSTGNAEVTLTFDVHRAAPSPAAAQALGLRTWRLLTTQPNGVLRFQTAFLQSKSCPLIDWLMVASCRRVVHEEVDVDTSPFEHAASCHLTYEFNVSLSEEGID